MELSNTMKALSAAVSATYSETLFNGLIRTNLWVLAGKIFGFKQPEEFYGFVPQEAGSFLARYDSHLERVDPDAEYWNVPKPAGEVLRFGKTTVFSDLTSISTQAVAEGGDEWIVEGLEQEFASIRESRPELYHLISVEDILVTPEIKRGYKDLLAAWLSRFYGDSLAETFAVYLVDVKPDALFKPAIEGQFLTKSIKEFLEFPWDMIEHILAVLCDKLLAGEWSKPAAVDAKNIFQLSAPVEEVEAFLITCPSAGYYPVGAYADNVVNYCVMENRSVAAVMNCNAKEYPDLSDRILAFREDFNERGHVLTPFLHGEQADHVSDTAYVGKDFYLVGFYLSTKCCEEQMGYDYQRYDNYDYSLLPLPDVENLALLKEADEIYGILKERGYTTDRA